MRTYRGVAVFVLSLFSIAFKLPLTIGAFHNCYWMFTGSNSLEHINYFIDALIVILIWVGLNEKLKKWVSKLFSGIGVMAGYLMLMMASNYTWQALRSLFIFDDLPFFKFVLIYVNSGLKYYIKRGRPGYHWVVLALAVIFVVISLITKLKAPIAKRIKNALYKRATDPSKKDSAWLSCDEACITIADHFAQYLTDEERDVLRPIYVDILAEQMAYKVWRAFPEQDSISDEPEGNEATPQNADQPQDDNIK